MIPYKLTTGNITNAYIVFPFIVFNSPNMRYVSKKATGTDIVIRFGSYRQQLNFEIKDHRHA